MTSALSDPSAATTVADGPSYVTAEIGGQLFGLPIDRVQDVFSIGALTPVPLSPPDVVGLMNMRGRVVTALDIRQRLGLAQGAVEPGTMAIGIEAAGDSYGLVVERIGEIVSPSREDCDPNPIHLDPSWAALSRGVHRLKDELLVVLDVDAILGLPARPANNPRAPENLQ